MDEIFDSLSNRSLPIFLFESKGSQDTNKNFIKTRIFYKTNFKYL